MELIGLLSNSPVPGNDVDPWASREDTSDTRESSRQSSTRVQRQHRLAPDAVLDLVRAYEGGATIKRLAAEFQVSRSTIMAHLKRRGVKTRYNRMEGQLDEARELRAQGWSYARLGKHFSVTAHTVRRVLLDR